MCVCGSSFQWFMGIIGGSTRANRPNRRFIRCSTSGIIGKKHGWTLIIALGHGRLIGIIRYMYNIGSVSS